MRVLNKIIGKISLPLILVLLLSGCWTKEPDKPGQSSAAASDKTNSPITLDFYINYSWWPQTKENWGQDLASKEITRITGVTLNIYKSANSEEDMTKLSMMMSTGDLPDIVMADDGVLLKKLIQKGMFQPLNDLIEKYGQELIKNIGWDYLENYCTEPDGKIYGLPHGSNFHDQNPESGGGVLILQGLYERLGSPPLNTLDDVYAYLVKVRDSGLKTRNGETYIPSIFDWPTQDLAGSFGLRFFTIDGGSYVYGEDKKLRHVLRVPEMKDIFYFTSKLFREGLIDQEWFLQDTNTAFNKLISGRIAMFFPTNAFGWLDEYNDTVENQCGDSYILIKTPTVPGVTDPKYNLVRQRPWTRIYMTSKCKDPVRTMEFFNWLSGETGQYVSRIGPEGLVWEWGPDGKPRATEEFMKKLSESRDDALREIGYYKWCFLQNNRFSENAVTALMNEKQREERLARANIIKESIWYAPELEKLSIDPVSKTGIANTKINSFFGKMDRKLYMAQTDEEFEQLYSSALPEMERLGLADVEEELNRQIAKNLNKASK